MTGQNLETGVDLVGAKSGARFKVRCCIVLYILHRQIRSFITSGISSAQGKPPTFGFIFPCNARKGQCSSFEFKWVRPPPPPSPVSPPMGFMLNNGPKHEKTTPNRCGNFEEESTPASQLRYQLSPQPYPGYRACHCPNTQIMALGGSEHNLKKHIPVVKLQKIATELSNRWRMRPAYKR